MSYLKQLFGFMMYLFVHLVVFCLPVKENQKVDIAILRLDSIGDYILFRNILLEIRKRNPEKLLH